MKKIMFIMLSALLLIVPSIIAFGPNTHLYIAETSLSKTNSSIAELCKANRANFYDGFIMPDVSVIYYYTSYREYQGTHNWNFVTKCLEQASGDKQKAFCYGVASHLASDAISHNYYIPNKIAKTKVGDYIVHVLVEGKVDAFYVDPRTTKAMDTLEEDVVFYNKVLGKDVTTLAKALRVAIGGGKFYGESYKMPEVGFSYTVYSKLSVVVKLLVSSNDAETFVNKAVDSTSDVLQGSYPYLDPTGHDPIVKADTEIITFYLVFMIISIGIFIAYMFKYNVFNVRRFKR